MKKPPSPGGSETANRLLLKGFVYTLALVFRIAWLTDARFRRAVRAFRAVYLFHDGGSRCALAFRPNGRFYVSSGAGLNPDYTVKFLDLPDAVGRLADDPNNVLKLLMENQVDPEGNVYYLFHFGYLCELCRPYFKMVAPAGKAAAELTRTL